MKTHYTHLHSAVGHLLKKDSFNKSDKPFAQNIHLQKEWTTRQARAIQRMLKKYRTVLDKEGIDSKLVIYSKIEESVDLPWMALRKGKRIELNFDSKDRNKYYKALNEIKDIPYRKLHKEKKLWEIPLTVLNVKTVKNIGFNIDSKLEDFLMSEKENKVKKVIHTKDADMLALKAGIPEMYDFQKEGLLFIERMGGFALLSDQPGLGKSLQSLAYAKLHKELRPVICVVPASLKYNWRKETTKWIQEDSYILSGTKKPQDYNDENIIIINYDIMKYHAEYLKTLNPKMIILDEVHKLKNANAQRTKACVDLCGHNSIESIVALSGTPIVNRPLELWVGINLLKPEIFRSHYRFKQKYCPSDGGVNNAEELYDVLTEHVMIRRLKKDVLKDLPDKTISVIPFPLSNRAEYEEAEEDVIEYISSFDSEAAERAARAETLSQFNILKQLAAKGKMDSVIEWIDEFLESGEKLVVFALHRHIIKALMDHYGDLAVKIDGSVSNKNRQLAVDRFQNDPKVKLFIGQSISASEGITLTVASNLCILESAWSPAINEQCSDRIHRISQENACNIYYMVADNTIDEELLQLMDKKQEIISAVLNGEGMNDSDKLTHLKEKADENIVAEMVKKYKDKRVS